MKFSVSPRKILVACMVFLTGFGLWLYIANREPENSKELEAVLKKRFTIAVDLGWQWLHVENVQVLTVTGSNKTRDVLFLYEVVFDSDAAELPQAEVDRYTKFLPMCANIPLEKGNRCTIKEEMEFIETEEYGFIPSVYLSFRPDLVPLITEEPEDNAHPQSKN